MSRFRRRERLARRIGTIERQVLTTIDHLDHPRFFAYIPSSSNFVGAMADTLASGYNIFNALYPLGQARPLSRDFASVGCAGSAECRKRRAAYLSAAAQWRI